MDRAVAAGTEYFLVVKVRIIVGHIVKTIVGGESHGVWMDPFSEILSCVTAGKEALHGFFIAKIFRHVTEFGVPRHHPTKKQNPDGRRWRDHRATTATIRRQKVGPADYMYPIFFVKGPTSVNQTVPCWPDCQVQAQIQRDD